MYEMTGLSFYLTDEECKFEPSSVFVASVACFYLTDEECKLKQV